MVFARYRIFILTALASAPSVAYGEDSEAVQTPPIAVSFNAGVVSDYRFRGLSLSNRDPALQGGVDASHSSGVFLGAWSSTVADTGGSNVEVDLYGGYANEVAGVGYSFSAVGYVYPGGEGVNYAELFGNFNKSIGETTTYVQIAYIPEQANFSNSNVYVSTSFDTPLPGTPLWLNAGVGRESSVGFRKWDWTAGVSWSFDTLTWSAAYVDSNFGEETESGRLGRAGAVISLIANF